MNEELLKQILEQKEIDYIIDFKVDLEEVEQNLKIVLKYSDFGKRNFIKKSEREFKKVYLEFFVLDVEIFSKYSLLLQKLGEEEYTKSEEGDFYLENLVLKKSEVFLRIKNELILENKRKYQGEDIEIDKKSDEYLKDRLYYTIKWALHSKLDKVDPFDNFCKRELKESFGVKKYSIKKVLVPTYILKHTYKNKEYKFIAEGITGEITGSDFPKSKLKKGNYIALFFIFIFVSIILNFLNIVKILFGNCIKKIFKR